MIISHSSSHPSHLIHSFPSTPSVHTVFSLLFPLFASSFSSSFPLSSPSHSALQHWWRIWVFSSRNPRVCHAQFFVRSCVVCGVDLPPTFSTPSLVPSSSPLLLLLPPTRTSSPPFFIPPSVSINGPFSGGPSLLCVRVCWPHTSSYIRALGSR